MKHVIQVGERTLEVDVQKRSDGTFAYRVDGGPQATVQVASAHPNELILRRDATLSRHVVDRRKGQLHGVTVGEVHVSGTVLDAKALADRRKHGVAGARGEWTLTAPMPGRVTKILVAVGQALKAGDPVVVVEAMKMENELRAPAEGVVTHVSATVGVPVDAGAVLVKAGPPAGAA